MLKTAILAHTNMYVNKCEKTKQIRLYIYTQTLLLGTNWFKYFVLIGPESLLPPAGGARGCARLFPDSRAYLSQSRTI